MSTPNQRLHPGPPTADPNTTKHALKQAAVNSYLGATTAPSVQKLWLSGPGKHKMRNNVQMAADTIADLERVWKGSK